MRNALLDDLPKFEPGEGEIITDKFDFEVITPMFGGDANSWELNLKAPVRAQSIKGQLRFWWRTMQNEQDYSELLRRENAMWGGDTGKDKDGNNIVRKSTISLEIKDQKILVSDVESAKLNDKQTMLMDGVIPAYVAFPVRDAVKDGKDIKYISNARFSLSVSYPKNDQTVVWNTLKLWTLFGGVGARTRRGCGSLYCEKLLRNINDAADIQQLIKVAGSDSPLGYCRLAGATLAAAKCHSSEDSALKAWSKIINDYVIFRQSRNGRFGRSHWPEPDAIRILTGKAAPLHDPEHPDGVWFPRAAFGLPIITQFKGDDDPADVQLAPSSAKRWPSPVFIKAIKLSSCILKVALVLNQEFPKRLELSYSKPDDQRRLPNIDEVPTNAHPSEAAGKVMRKNDPFDGSVYQALFKGLGVEAI